MTPTESDSGLKDSTYPRCQKCSGRFVPTSFEQAYCLECSHELLGEDMIKAQPEQPPAREAKCHDEYNLVEQMGNFFVFKVKEKCLAMCSNRADAQQIIDALNGQAELARAKERIADLVFERNEQQKTIANYAQWLADATKELAQAKELVERARPQITCPMCRENFDNDDERLMIGVCPVCEEPLPAELRALRAILQKGKQP